MVTVRLFAGLRERAGRDVLELPLEKTVTVARFLERLFDRLPNGAALKRDHRVLVAVNQESADDETPVRDGDEVALMPPFSGGEPGGPPSEPRDESAQRIRIQREDFSVDRAIADLKAASPRMGGIAVFLGTARDFSKGRTVRKLAYEHYTGMAERVLSEIRSAALKRFEIIDCVIRHRIGEISPGENIVLVAVGAEHRAEALDACRWCIDELKKTVPIWKKEFTPEGDIWVEDRP
jgi:molybdopterin converting factor subunit 1